MHIEEDEEQTQQRGMAANAILKSIPAHVLKALEQQQTEADELNQQTKVHFMAFDPYILVYIPSNDFMV